MKLVPWTHIEDGHSPGPQPIQQLGARYRLQLVPRAEIGRHDAGDFGAVPLAHPAQRVQQTDNGIFTRQPVEHPLSLSAALDQRRASKKLQVPGCVRHRQSRPSGKVFDAPLALAEMFEQFEPMAVAERLCDLSETGEYALFGTEA